MREREDCNPGKFKDKNSQAENTLFVDQRLVKGTLMPGFKYYAVVVNPANPVSKLTRVQLGRIFTGTITNRKQVGGADLKITSYSRESSSETYKFFKEHVLLNKNYVNSILSMPATGAIIQ